MSMINMMERVGLQVDGQITCLRSLVRHKDLVLLINGLLIKILSLSIKGCKEKP